MMKVLKDLSLLLIAFLWIGSMVACSSEEGNMDNPNVPTEFTPSQESTIYFSDGIDFGANVGEQEINFTSNKSWSVSSTASWCRALPAQGSASDGSFLIVVDENQTIERREGVLTLKVGEMNNYITVRQGGAGSAKIHVAEAGTLSALLGDNYEQITDLTLTGELNGTDFKFMREKLAISLKRLDLEEARIVAGGDAYISILDDYYTVKDKITPYLLASFPYLSELKLPSSITSIEDYGLSGLIELLSLDIPESVDSIGLAAFSICTKLERVNLPEELDYLGDMAFGSCVGLQEIELPQSLSYISYGLFSGCKDLQNIELPLSVDSIAWAAFSGCESLTKLVIPASVESLGIGIWSDCSSLTTLEYHTRTISWASCPGTSISEIIIGSEVEEIKSLAFSDYKQLRTLTIPATVKSIESGIFNAGSMETLHMQSATPPETRRCLGGYTHEGMNTCTLYVPRGSKAAYEAVGCPWTDFKEIIEE